MRGNLYSSGMVTTRTGRIAATFITSALIAAPALALAQEATTTASGIEAQIKALLAQVDSLNQ